MIKLHEMHRVVELSDNKATSVFLMNVDGYLYYLKADVDDDNNIVHVREITSLDRWFEVDEDSPSADNIKEALRLGNLSEHDGSFYYGN